jgi:tetrahydromethanopterin S-methyltransferase subunit C
MDEHQVIGVIAQVQSSVEMRFYQMTAEKEQMVPSPTLEEALRRLSSAGPVSAVGFAQAILGSYDHIKVYADGKFASLTSPVGKSAP